MEGHDGFGGAKLPSQKLEANVRYLRSVFEGDDTLQIRELRNRTRPEAAFCLIYADGMIDNKLMNDDVVRPLMEFSMPEETDSLIDVLM